MGSKTLTFTQVTLPTYYTYNEELLGNPNRHRLAQ